MAYRVDFTEAAAPGTSQWFDATGFYHYENWVTFAKDDVVVGAVPSGVVRAIVREDD